MVSKRVYKNFGDYYNVESPIGRKEFSRQLKEEKDKQAAYEKLDSTIKARERTQSIKRFLAPVKTSSRNIRVVQSNVNVPIQRTLNRSYSFFILSAKPFPIVPNTPIKLSSTLA